MSKFLRGWHILWVIFTYGLDELVLNNIRHRRVTILKRIFSFRRNLSAPQGERLRKALEKLGPIFVKFGQVLSTRRDLLPAELANDLALLQDRVPPFSGDLAVEIIEKSFGRPIDEIFLTFDRTPIASASIAQVHLATIVDKNNVRKEVAVKVLRPGTLIAIEKDLALLHMMASWLEKLSSDGKRLKPREVVREFDTYLHDELDLMREAANAAQLRRNMKDLDLVLLPEIIWDYCHTDVMVMQRMSGIPIGQIDRLKENNLNLGKLAKDGVTIFFTQVFYDGFFHGDMHPGNILVSTAPQNFGRFILLDFGIVGSLTDFDKEYLAQNFIAFFRRDYKRIAELHVESGWVPADTRITELEAAVRTVCEPYFDRPLKEISLGMVLMRLFQTSRRFQVEIQPQLVLLQKTLLNIEGLGRQLDPDLDLWSTAKPFLERWVHEQSGPKRLLEELRNEAPRYAQILPALPRLLQDYLTYNSVQKKHDLEIHALLLEQKRTNNLLQTALYTSLGIFLGILLVFFLI